MPTDPAFDDSDEEVIVLYNLAAVAFRHDVAEACPPRLEPLGPEKLLFWRSRLSVFHKMMGMSIETFDALKDFCVQNGLRRTRYMEIDEKLSLFLYIYRFGVS